ncbi:GNAT family N-acetyltransferase [Streptomyces cocklensis]|jgi:phosphinothricin acetyltransferase|uniref:Phosphinothricin N-acetyltransferase n=1 Tax=Actinacidiphila cocklensis TaxID=887465 RepID=A0A9W4GWT6_9ACTN|nr:GNAT family N-acetyltransferase [Actinacidiphila cocklensis]MDD1057413.1 GNAT family N-acetyltransferase [Actinacidiphila cocklensis]WSX79059.1 GNAT family N-acetyltransferase [Streptomyces sp. NBC_00899]CAG6399298.1 Phosphinothricin N-acetyltransferase [Actinacidiphila cocklensis]
MPERTEVQVRAGRDDDLVALTDIYNHYIRETPITFDISPITPDERRPWLLSHPEDGPHRLLVAQPESDGRILGYATSSPFRPKAAYATSVETSIYLAPDAGGRGIGTLLYTALFEALAEEDVHRAYAGVTLPNEASIRIHQRFGFKQIGVYEEVGRKFGAYHDVAWLEKRLS